MFFVFFIVFLSKMFAQHFSASAPDARLKFFLWFRIYRSMFPQSTLITLAIIRRNVVTRSSPRTPPPALKEALKSKDIEMRLDKNGLTAPRLPVP